MPVSLTCKCLFPEAWGLPGGAGAHVHGNTTMRPTAYGCSETPFASQAAAFSPSQVRKGWKHQLSSSQHPVFGGFQLELQNKKAPQLTLPWCCGQVTIVCLQGLQEAQEMCAWLVGSHCQWEILNQTQFTLCGGDLYVGSFSLGGQITVSL